MPRRNGTGPDGAGPLTGRGMGPCKKDSKKTDQTSTGGGFFGRGRGAGQGRGFFGRGRGVN